MTHPSQSTLALYAGKDLGWFRRRRAENHLAHCRECREEVETFASVRDDLVELNEMPAVSWNRLAAEMRANIRLGLAAGECVRSEAGTPLEWLSAPRAMLAGVCMVLLVAAGLFLEQPGPAPLPVVAGDGGVVLRATANGIELEQGGQKLSLLHVRAAADDQGRPMVSYSAGAQGSMRARYVDADTGNVTINNVYVQ